MVWKKSRYWGGDGGVDWKIFKYLTPVCSWLCLFILLFSETPFYIPEIAGRIRDGDIHVCAYGCVFASAPTPRDSVSRAQESTLLIRIPGARAKDNLKVTNPAPVLKDFFAWKEHINTEEI